MLCALVCQCAFVCVCIYIIREADPRKGNANARKTAKELYKRHTWSLPIKRKAGPADRRELQKQIAFLKCCVAQLKVGDERKAAGVGKLSVMRQKIKQLKANFGRYGQPSLKRAVGKALKRATNSVPKKLVEREGKEGKLEEARPSCKPFARARASGLEEAAGSTRQAQPLRCSAPPTSANRAFEGALFAARLGLSKRRRAPETADLQPAKRSRALTDSTPAQEEWVPEQTGISGRAVGFIDTPESKSVRGKLRDHIHASIVKTVPKLYNAGSPECHYAESVGRQGAVEALLACEVFDKHRRCEANYELDGGAMHLRALALACGESERLQMGLAKATLMPKDGMLGAVCYKYIKATGKLLWCAAESFSPGDLVKALRGETLDMAYPRYRRNFFEAEKRRQRATPGQLQVPEESAYPAEQTKTVFANYWAHLHDTGAFEKALKEFKSGAPIRRVLEETLLVHTSWHRMLVARELQALLKDFPTDGAVQMITVGGGAAKVVRESVGKHFDETESYDQVELLEDLSLLHELLLRELDMHLIALVCPKGWLLDFTEHGCCERRRYDDALRDAANGKQPRRKREQKKGTSVDERQIVRSRRLLGCWQLLGFSNRPSRASFALRRQ
jgi:hypothetical protein